MPVIKSPHARDTGFCYNPLHNDLDPYARGVCGRHAAEHLFGRGKEPFWQQAYTDVLKFVISLRPITEGYTTLLEVYRYVINDSPIDRNIRNFGELFPQPREYFVASILDYETQVRHAPWTLWEELGAHDMAHQHRGDLEGFLAAHDNAFSVRKGRQAVCADRRHGWMRSLSGSTGPGRSARTRSRHRSWKESSSFCRCSTRIQRYTGPSARSDPRTRVPPQPGEKQPLPPLEDRVGKGRVLGLNFPVALNPASARCGVEAGFSARRAESQFPRSRQIRVARAETSSSSRTSTTRLQPLDKPTGPETSAHSRCHVKPASFPSSRRRASVLYGLP